MQIDSNIQNYIETYIFPSYQKNDKGHDLEHIKYVIERSLKFANKIENINYNMVYVIAPYHDIGYYIDAKNHEKISAEMLFNDNNLKRFFTDEEIKIMTEAVHDHRASMKSDPRSIYGKIVSSADRETRVNVQLQRMYEYRLTHYPDKLLDWMIEDTRLYIINKFGKNGYATEKMYFEDLDYKKYLEDINDLAQNYEVFKEIYCISNNISHNKQP